MSAGAAPPGAHLPRGPANLNLIAGIVLVIAVTVIVANALADVAVAPLDPRVRVGARSG